MYKFDVYVQKFGKVKVCMEDEFRKLKKYSRISITSRSRVSNKYFNKCRSYILAGGQKTGSISYLLILLKYVKYINTYVG